MAAIEVNGGRVVYEFVGPGDGEVVLLTPGGGFGRDVPGVRLLVEALVAGGMRVLLWDPPDCGASDVQLFGRTESHVRAETLGAMLTKLNTGPVFVAGGADGARDSLVFTTMYPELVKKLAVWSIGSPAGSDGIGALPDWQLDGIDVPTLILCGGEEDLDHPQRTSLEVHALIKGSRLVELPWAEGAWERAAPPLLEFFDAPDPTA